MKSKATKSTVQYLEREKGVKSNANGYQVYPFCYIRWAHKKLLNYPLLNNKSKIKTTTTVDQEQGKKKLEQQ